MRRASYDEIFGSEHDGSRHAKERKQLEELTIRLARLDSSIGRLLETPQGTAGSLDTVFDAARWASFYADLALAFHRQVHPVRDASWRAERYRSEQDARAFLVSFRDTVTDLSPARFDLVELHNLRSRLDGLKSVLEGWRRAPGQHRGQAGSGGG